MSDKSNNGMSMSMQGSNDMSGENKMMDMNGGKDLKLTTLPFQIQIKKLIEIKVVNIFCIIYLENMDGNMDMMMMSMSFEAGTNVTILFKSWKTTDAWSLFGSVVCINTRKILEQSN